MNIWKDHLYQAATGQKTSLLRPDGPLLTKAELLSDLFILWARSDEYETASCTEREHLRGYWMALMDMVSGR